jgi:hypothetical protein
MSNIQLKQVGITTMQERTWGRVFLNYEENGVDKYIFKNWIYFEEYTFKSDGSFESEPAFTWFNNQEIASVKDVLMGRFDHMNLTPSNHKSSYGTPSIILNELLGELEINEFTNVEERRNWYAR